MNCKKCKNPLEERKKFCPQCGTGVIFKRIDWHFIFDEIKQIFNLEKGIFFTVRELIIQPGNAVRTYIEGDRQRMVKPIFFLFATAITYVFIGELFHVELYQKSGPEMPVEFNEGMNWISSNMAYVYLFLCLIYSLWSRLLFWKQSYNIVEIFVFNCYTSGLVMVSTSIILIFQVILKFDFNTNSIIASVVTCLYYSWAMTLFFNGNKFVVVLKSLAVILLSMFTIFFVALIIVIAYLLLSNLL